MPEVGGVITRALCSSSGHAKSLERKKERKSRKLIVDKRPLKTQGYALTVSSPSSIAVLSKVYISLLNWFSPYSPPSVKKKEGNRLEFAKKRPEQGLAVVHSLRIAGP